MKERPDDTTRTYTAAVLTGTHSRASSTLLRCNGLCTVVLQNLKPQCTMRAELGSQTTSPNHLGLFTTLRVENARPVATATTRQSSAIGTLLPPATCAMVVGTPRKSAHRGHEAPRVEAKVAKVARVAEAEIRVLTRRH